MQKTTITKSYDSHGRLLVDVTQLIHLTGPVTGIPRVMHELAVRFHEDRPDALFVSWVKEVDAYCLVDFEASVLNRGNGIKYLKNNEQPNVSRGHNVAEKQFDKVGFWGRGAIFAKRGIRFSIYQTGRINPALPDRIMSKFAKRKALYYQQIRFKKDDTVFISWGEWWDKNFLTMLEVAKQKEGVRLSTIIHDVGPMVTPHLSGHSSNSLADYCRRIVPICDVVFVNSKHTGQELKAWLKSQFTSIPPISIFTLGDDFKFAKPQRPTDEAFKNSGLKGGDYIMTVGTVELKKNHVFLYYVYYLARQRGIQLPKLVIVGRKGWNTDVNINLMRNDPVLGEKFIFLFNTSDNELAWLYDNCLFTVFPSFYEGWGIPIAESLFHGIPSLSANVTSMVEIGDGIVKRFSPASTDECLDAITSLLKPANLKKAKAKVATYKPVTWDETYRQIKRKLEEERLI